MLDIKLTKLGKFVKLKNQNITNEYLYCLDAKNKVTNDILNLKLNTCGIYRFYKDGVIVYIGKSNNMLNRIKSHNHYENFDEFDFCSLQSKADMDVYEIYYINKYKPMYNKDCNTQDNMSFEIKDLSFSNKYFKEDLFINRFTIRKNKFDKLLLR